MISSLLLFIISCHFSSFYASRFSIFSYLWLQLLSSCDLNEYQAFVDFVYTYCFWLSEICGLRKCAVVKLQKLYHLSLYQCCNICKLFCFLLLKRCHQLITISIVLLNSYCLSVFNIICNLETVLLVVLSNLQNYFSYLRIYTYILIIWIIIKDLCYWAIKW